MNQTPTWLTILLAVLPVLAVLAGSFLTAWQQRAANKITLEQSKLQIDADLKKVHMQAEHEEKRRELEQSLELRRLEHEAKSLANQRVVERLEGLAIAASELHSAQQSGHSDKVADAYAAIVRYAGTARTEGFDNAYLFFIRDSKHYPHLSDLQTAIERAISERSQTEG